MGRWRYVSSLDGLHLGCVIEDDAELGAVVLELFIIELQASQARNMSNVDFDGHGAGVYSRPTGPPATVGAVGTRG